MRGVGTGWLLLGLLSLAPSCKCRPAAGDEGGAATHAGCEPHCPPPPAATLGRAPAPNPIVAENLLLGDPDWRTGHKSDKRQLELYTSLDSVAAGMSFGVKVSTDTAQQVSASVYRVGYYRGAGARRVWSGGPYATFRQPDCPRDPATALVECAWADTFTVEVPGDWVSGLYLVKVTRADGTKRFAPFVVRDRRAAEVLFTPAFHTYQAYDRWGGESLYFDGSGTMPNGKATQVTYDRPYQDDEGAGQMLRWDLPLAQLLEAHGYDVTYATQLDFTRFSDLLGGIGLFVNGGHDEYWGAEERAQVDAALAAGTMSLAHFGGNAAYWRVRTLSSSAGAPMRILVCYKGPDGDPEPGSTVRFRDEPAAHPENALFGTMYDGWQVVDFPLTVSNPTHWIYAGTNLKAGDLLPGLVGYEYDRLFDNGFTPPGVSIFAEGAVVRAEGIPSFAQGVERTLPNGRLVFSAGTIYWALALGDDPELKDGRVERMTLNVLERGLDHRRTPAVLAPVTGPAPSSFPPDPAWASAVSAVAGRAGVAGWVDGPGDAASFAGPTGLAALPSGQLLVADTLNSRLRLIEPDAARTVRTLAGNGQVGSRDGDGAVAKFRLPTAVVLGADGAAYVADSDNYCIRRVGLVAPYPVTTWAGALHKAGTADGPADQARFGRPTALVADAAGNLYVTDQSNNLIRRVDAVTREVTTLAGSGATGGDDGAERAASFNNPSGIAVAPDGTLYVYDGGSGRVRRIAPDAGRTVSTIAGQLNRLFGYRDGTGDVARFRGQMGFVLSAAGDLYLADTANYRIRKIVPGADAASTRVYTFAGSGRGGTALGTAQESDLVAPAGLAFTPAGQLVVSDSYHHVIRAITP